MNIINKQALSSLGYQFIAPPYLPAGKDEYYLRNLQNKSGIRYRHLTTLEMEVLVRNGNQSDNWSRVMVSDAFNPELVKNCKFFGLVRIGKLEPYYLEFHNLRMPVGLYNSTIISCDFGNNVAVDNVKYISHYIVGNDVMLANVNELATTDRAKFGNGILKEGEKESIRIRLEICNENGGRSIVPFSGMLPGDAWLWSRYRNDEVLMQKLLEFTDKRMDNKRGYYGMIGDRTVIKNCKIIKDVWIGSDAYLKGANKLKNLTIHSTAEAGSQIGEGCEIVNGIIGEGCRIFYGVKAVRFIMASHSQLKYGARLINSYLGNNATISCCEVLNSLIFPAHEQHHNNSFLCAATIMGQSNMAAGATIGSNHNSRGADGELMAGRGFWPGLCVSLKHNSRFACFTILAKADYPAELDIPIPFSLVSNDTSKDELVIMPAYWFLYNMYALERNAWKYIDRDKRTDKIQHIEYEYLAPDTMNEVIESLYLMEKLTGKAYLMQSDKKVKITDETACKEGRKLLRENNTLVDQLTILAEGFENSHRKVKLIKVRQSYTVFSELISCYAAQNLLQQPALLKEWSKKSKAFFKRQPWLNVGGQLMELSSMEQLKDNIRKGKIRSWEEIHQYYQEAGSRYSERKTYHAMALYTEWFGECPSQMNRKRIQELMKEMIRIREWMLRGIIESRKKDYTSPFRTMMYESEAEMEKVIGRFSDNAFIRQQKEALRRLKQAVK